MEFLTDHLYVFKDLLSKYILEFVMGDANDSCVAEFLVYVQVGTPRLCRISQCKVLQTVLTTTVPRLSSSVSELPSVLASLKESRTSNSVLCFAALSSGVKVNSVARL